MSDHIHLTCRKSINQSDSGLLHDNPSVDKTVCRTRISPPPHLGIKDKLTLKPNASAWAPDAFSSCV